MALDPKIALAGQTPQFSLLDLGKVYGQGQLLQANQLFSSEEQRRLAEADAVRQAYAQQYGGGAPAGLAGAAPMTAPGTDVPVQERQLGGAPSTAFPAATAPPGGPQAAGGLAGLGEQLGVAGGARGGPAQPLTPARQDPFVRKLYTISPQAGRVAERHAYDTQALQFAQHLERVEYLGRIAEGVLEADTQQAYNVGRQMLLEAGMPPGQMPPAYDRSLMQMYAGVARDSGEKLRLAQARLAEAKAQSEQAKAPDYGYGDAVNAALYARYGAQIPPGQPPSPAQLQQAQQDVQEGKVAVSEATGARGAEAKALGQTAQKRLEDLDKAGLTAQTMHTTLDEVDRLIGEGIYGNSPQDRLAMAGYRSGLRQGDTKAQRTARLQELGNELILAHGTLGSGVSVKDAEIYAKAAGNFQAAKNPQEMRESIKSMRAILNKAVDYANKTRAHYEQTGALPPFEGRAPAGTPGHTPAGGRSPYAGRAVESLTPEQAREELDWMEQHYTP